MKIQSPEEKQLSNQIAEVSARIEVLKKSLKSKIKDLDKAISNDNANLFGERNSEPESVIILFSERVDTTQRNKVLEPIKTALFNAENELKKLHGKKENLTQTGTLF